MIAHWLVTIVAVFGTAQLHLVGDEWSVGPKSVLYIRVSFADDSSEPISSADAAAAMSFADGFFQSQSYGLASFNSTITPLLQLPESKAFYGGEPPIRLLQDAREVASDAGFDTDGYDLDVVRFNPVPGWSFSGTSSVGQKNLWLQHPSLGVLVHELGHNLGMEHADLWSTVDGSATGPGNNGLYGDVFDTMGQPQSNPSSYHFNTYWKWKLGWLATDQISNIVSNGVYRLYRFDQLQLDSLGKYALVIGRDEIRDYWIEYRRALTGNVWSQSGIVIHWSPSELTGRNTVLLDTTQGSIAGAADSPLLLGRTLSDSEAGIHITPVGMGMDGMGSWMEVRVSFEDGSVNVPPTAALVAPSAQAEPGETLNFLVDATDPDGDPLTHRWDFGNGSIGTNALVASHAWSSPGEYVVRCLVSDGRGGLGADSVVVTVGSPGTTRISGVVTENGMPVLGARVSVSSAIGVETDSDGNYSLVGLAPGEYTVTARLPGRTLTSSGFTNPLTLGASGAININFSSVSDPPSIVRQPQDRSVNAAADPSFFVQASGAPPLKYQWHFNGEEIVGATGPAISLTKVSVAQAGAYQVKVWNSAGTNLSQSASLTVTDPPRIVRQPTGGTFNVGAAVTIFVEALGAEPLEYYWLRNNTELIEDAVGPSYTISQLTVGHAGVYSVLIVNDDGFVASSNATLIVNQLPVPAAPVMHRLSSKGVKRTVAAFVGSDPDGDPLTLNSVGPGTANGGTVAADDRWVHYTPAPGDTADDSFAFTVSDDRGGTAAGTATVVVVPDEIIPDNFRVEVLPNGDYQLAFDGIPDRTYSIQYTEQLNPPAFQQLTSITADGSGRFIHIDSPPPGAPSRYYRAAYP